MREDGAGKRAKLESDGVLVRFVGNWIERSQRGTP